MQNDDGGCIQKSRWDVERFKEQERNTKKERKRNESEEEIKKIH